MAPCDIGALLSVRVSVRGIADDSSKHGSATQGIELDELG
jgi:hypothetical protein